MFNKRITYGHLNYLYQVRLVFCIRPTRLIIKRACLECIRNWQDRPSFIHARNKWPNFKPEVQRMLWLASFKFGDDGK